MYEPNSFFATCDERSVMDGKDKLSKHRFV